MSIEEIRSYRNAKPFKPFVLCLVDGRTLNVPHALRLGIAPWGKVGVSDGIGVVPLKPGEITGIRLVEAAAQ